MDCVALTDGTHCCCCCCLLPSCSAFITSNGSTLEKFVDACDKAEEESFALQLILSITSFEAFKQLMLEQKAKGKYNVQ